MTKEPIDESLPSSGVSIPLTGSLSGLTGRSKDVLPIALSGLSDGTTQRWTGFVWGSEVFSLPSYPSNFYKVHPVVHLMQAACATSLDCHISQLSERGDLASAL